METNDKPNQAQTLEKTDIEEEFTCAVDTTDNMLESCSDPFARRDSIQRTPPGLSRLLALNNTPIVTTEKPREVEEVWEKPSKRKRSDLTPEQKTDKKADNIGNLMENIFKKIAKLHVIVKNIHKPKQELKDVTSQLRSYANQLQTNEFKDWIRKTSEENVQASHIREENESLKVQLKELLSNTGKDVLPVNGVHCESCKETQTINKRRKTLKENETFENFQSITEEEWNNNIFPALDSVPKNIWDAPDGSYVLLPCNTQFQSKFKSVELAINRLGDRELLSKQNKSKGDVVAIFHTLGFPDENGKVSHITRNILLPLFSEGNEEAEMETIFKTAEAIKKLALQHEGKCIGVPKMEGKCGLTFQRVLQYLFAQTNKKLNLYTSPGITNKNPKVNIPKLHTPAADKKNPSVITPHIRKDKQSSEIMVVKMRDKTYADLLKTIKNSINPSEIGVEVKNVTKNKNGELLVTVSNGKDKAEVLRQEIRNRLPEANISFVNKTKIIHIKRMDEVVTTEEIKEAIYKKTGIDPASYEVRKLRPAYGNKQNATIIMSAGSAQKLIELGSIRIGWIESKIVERKIQPKCYRCWVFGHKKAQCKGPNREQLCLKCAKDGHTAATCPNEPFCVHCETGGHQSDSGKCINKTRGKAEASKSSENDQGSPS